MGVIWVLRSSARPQADGTASLKINLTFISTVQSKKFVKGIHTIGIHTIGTKVTQKLRCGKKTGRIWVLRSFARQAG